VRRINVRSTEIETFDACSIIVPNSSLVVEPVKNWTHNDTLGRFMVAVTVDYASDPEQVRKFLLEAARQHPKVLSAPEPNVTLVRFGPAGLDFELRAYVADVFLAGLTASDIRFQLLTLFREKGITIPHPVTVLQQPGR
jgi:potassium-dependent mechanosensitive channel